MTSESEERKRRRRERDRARYADPAYAAKRSTPEAKAKRAARDARYRSRADVQARALETGRRTHLRLKFGITPERFDEMLADQGGLCAVCRKDPHGAKRAHVDHDHDTNAVRGILCNPCNQLLGFYEKMLRLGLERGHFALLDNYLSSRRGPQ